MACYVGDNHGAHSRLSASPSFGKGMMRGISATQSSVMETRLCVLEEETMVKLGTEALIDCWFLAYSCATKH